MNLSYWEKKTWFSNIDYCVVGSGIVGLSCALHLKKSHPKSKVLVLERGVLPNGASTKNAGFACFGSVSEILSDLDSHTESEVYDLVNQRYRGLKILRETLGDNSIGYESYGGYEVFLEQDKKLFEKCNTNIDYLNDLLHPIFKDKVFSLSEDDFQFKSTLKKTILNSFEGQLDVGKMMQKLLQKVQSLGVLVLNNIEVEAFNQDKSKVSVQLKGFEFYSKHLFIATNAFSKKLLDVDLIPARNQVIITRPIEDLPIRGVFHLQEGYYYFRNVGDRILLGGGRHIDKDGEATDKFETTKIIQTALEEILYEVISNNSNIEIEHRWSGILGVGKKKKPVLKSFDDRVHCAVRLGGMGVAIGSEVGRNLAGIIE